MKLDALLAFGHFNAGQPGQVIEMPPGTPEFAVGHGSQADGFLFGDHLTNACVFNSSQGLGIDSAVLEVGTGGLQS